MTMNLTDCRHYVTYSGVKLPLRLVNPLAETDIANRNTYFRAWFDAQEHMVLVQKVVYGEVELQHRYEYHASGRLMLAEITEADGESRVLRFDAQGRASVAGGRMPGANDERDSRWPRETLNK
jgi:hypothetical protein